MRRLAYALSLATLLATTSSCSDDTSVDPDAGEEVDVSDIGFPDVGTDADADAQADAADLDGEADAPPDVASDPDAEPLVCLGDEKPLISAIVNGTEEPTFVPLTDGQKLAIIRVAFWGTACSGTLISDTWVLTAKHCTEYITASDANIVFGDGRESNQAVIRATRIVENPNNDLSLIELSSSAGESLPDVEPIPPNTFSMADWVGRPVENSGFGTTEDPDHEGRYFATERLIEVLDSEFSVDGENIHGLCGGDSGGPSLVIAPDGTVRVAGALHGGSYSCVGVDTYTRVDTSIDWIEEYVDFSVREGAPCGPLSDLGLCQGDEAVYCGGDSLVVQTCEEGQSCAFDTESSGYRCIATAEDPCGGLDQFGQCDGATARWCQDGQTRARDCASCEQVCGIVDGTHGVDCVDTPCQGIDLEGECVGEVARWCDQGHFMEVDCEELGASCDFGRCDCADYGRQGSCVGDLAVWCNGYYLEVVNCADYGLSCEYVNSRIGYYCQ